MRGVTARLHKLEDLAPDHGRRLRYRLGVEEAIVSDEEESYTYLQVRLPDGRAGSVLIKRDGQDVPAPWPIYLGAEASGYVLTASDEVVPA